jgi:CDP-diacylglycerol--glycerol-3-phosphate 3-phosphatidyltransferase
MNTSDAITLPNSLTLLRVLLTPVFAALLFSESSFWKQIALLVFIVAALTDWYDGWVARRYGYVSRWGKFFDPLADKILAATALFSFVYLNLVDAWMVWIIVTRDFLITGLRTLSEYRNQPIVTSRSAQAKTLGEFVVIYYILILYVLRSIYPIHREYAVWFDTLLHPQVLFGMMLVVTLSNVGTGILYLFDNRDFLQKLAAVRWFTRFFATGLYSGYSPIAPGTAGTLVGVIIYAIPGFSEPIAFSSTILLVFFLGVWASAQIEREQGNDPQIVVIDEVVGMWISLFLLPRLIWTTALAFFLFRVFDTFKPFPARRIEKLEHGWGIMLDDVVAAVYTNILMHIIVQSLSFG